MGQILFCGENFCKTVNKEIGVYKEKLYPQHFSVIIGYNLNLSLKLIFCPTNSNLSLKICSKNVVDITFLVYK